MHVCVVDVVVVVIVVIYSYCHIFVDVQELVQQMLRDPNMTEAIQVHTYLSTSVYMYIRTYVCTCNRPRNVHSILVYMCVHVLSNRGYS